ncbi:FAD-dependent monooxygenase [Pelagibacterales bacterium SAG-MED07]|nr:FAD-dependent monooxygenase [Pelagibacterales bacterium SAG-MED07]
MKKVAIIGAGISGLFIANLFKKNPNYKVTIYEKNTSIILEEGYGIQLSVNSIKLLNEIGFKKLKNNEKFTPEKINFYSNKSSNKICDLNIADFNSEDCSYTTLKRSSLINFLKRDLKDLIKTGYNIKKIDQSDKQIKLSFENKEINECNYLIISDGVFSKSKSLISNNQTQPRYNDTLAIRGILKKSYENIDNKNISLFLGSNFHQVIYPTNPHGDLNFIAIMKYLLSTEEQKNYSLFSDNSFIKKVLEKIPSENKEFSDNLKELKIFPVFVSNNFHKLQNDNIHLIGDAFFAFPPSFAQGASQSIESAYELFKNIEKNTESNFFKNRAKKTKMVNIRSKLNQFAFHLSNPLTIFFRNIFLKRLVKNRKFLEAYLGKVYRN